MKVFLTGATGFVGSQVLQDLLEKGHQVRCLVREGSQGKLRVWEGVEIAIGDVLGPESLREKLRGCQAAIYLVGIIREFPRKGITFDRLHYQGARNVMEAANEQEVSRFLHMSALGARPGAPSRYHQTKYMAEEYLKESGLAYTIFRPSVIFGPKDEFVNLLARMIQKAPLVPVVGDGKYKLQPVALENVSQGFVRALEMPETVGKAYEVAGPEKLEYNQVLDIIGEALGRRVRKLHFPLSLMRPLVAGLEKFPSFPLTREQLIMLQEENVGDERPFFQDFGIRPLTFREGIARYIKRRG